MADTPTTAPLHLHLVNYVVLLIVILAFGWLWRDAQVRDAKTLAAVMETRQSQTVVDKQTSTRDTQALSQLEAQNRQLESALKQAQTTEEQIALINRTAGQALVEAPHQAINPSVQTPPAATLSTEQVKTLALDATTCKEAINQVATDKTLAASKDAQIAARNATIKAQEAEIKKARGSKIGRVMKALKYIGIGVGIGIVGARAGVL